MKKQKGFVISWYFPPINSSEGLCTFKLLKNSNHKYDVFTQKNNKNWSYDTNEDKLTAGNINTIFADTADIKDWVKEGIKYYENNKEKYDFIMSRSMAPESHEIALEIKKRNKEIFWIASFGDPIADNPYITLATGESPHKVKGKGIMTLPISYVLSPKRILKNIWWNYKDIKYKKKYTRIYKDKILQNEVLQCCDAIILNNEYQKEYMLKGYSKEIQEKTIVLPHGYDKDFYSKTKKQKTDKYRISYLGHLDYIRTPRNFLVALTLLKEKRRELYNRIQVSIYGNMDSEDKVFIIDNNICDVVRFEKPIKYFESLEVMKQSDLLLLIDANLGTIIPNNIFYAAKLADYIGSGSNIFGITMQDGPSASIIKEIGGVVSSHSVDDIYNNLVMILEGKINMTTKDKNNKYDIVTIANKYDEFLSKRR